MIHIGIIGAGNIANKFCEAVNKSHVDACLEAIGSRSLDKAIAFKEKYQVNKAYGSYEDLYNDDNIDLVYIAIPHAFHYEEMKKAISKNKHILCEKPFTLNANQAKVIFDMAREKKLFVMEALWTRFLPVIQSLKKSIDQGIIGNINLLTAEFCFKPNKDINHRLYQKHLGGGALLDIGIYPITLANIFLGKPKSFESKVTMYQTGVDASEIITYHYGKTKAILTASFIKESPLESIIEGSKGKVIINGLHDTESAKIYDNQGSLIKEINIPFEVNGFEYEIKEAISCIQNKHIQSLTMPHQETIDILKQMDDIRQSWHLSYPQES
jgi:predicted dehydrogenase